MTTNMTFITWLYNGFLYLKFYIFAYLFRCFDRVSKNDSEKKGYDLIFEDEFGSPVDWNKWRSHQTWGNVQNNVIYKESQVSQNESDVILTSDANNVSGEPPAKSGGLYSWNFLNIRYGYFETREKVSPHGFSYWNAFWLSGTDAWPPEIDVFELMGDNSSYFTMTLHWRDVTKNKDQIQEVYNEIYQAYGYVPTDFDDTIKFLQQPEWSQQKQDFIDTLQNLAQPAQQGRKLKFPGRDFLSNDYHTYACEWTDKKVVWYIDNVKVYKLDKNIPDKNMFLIINNGYTEGELPMSLNCDYVRVYREK